MRLLLIPVAHALPALEAYLEALPEDGPRMGEEELNGLARLATRVIETGEALADYVIALRGKPAMN